MQDILSNVKITINEKLYVKDPETSALGKKIIEQSILLIDEIGFDNFTFKKLGEKISSNESSLYRYFENKHKLLVYLSSWYWSWMEYKLVFATNNISDPKEKLRKAITIITEKVEDYRAKRITEYLNLLDRLINKQIEKLRLEPFVEGSEITKKLRETQKIT